MTVVTATSAKFHYVCAHDEADTSTFVERLRQSGFYNRWRREFGEKAWSLLEAQRGPLP